MLMPLATRLFILLSLLVPCSAFAAGLAPWKFGLTKAEVAGFKGFGPYKTFSNGDLETLNGRYHGRKENIQFFFERGRLRRIAVFLGEGTDRKKAVATCQQLYELLQREYGALTIPEDKSPKGAKPAPLGVQAIAATMNADLFGSTHIVPVKQPKDMRVFGAVRSAVVNGKKWFYVAVNLDPRI
jgi:hypothetical protein